MHGHLLMAKMDHLAEQIGRQGGHLWCPSRRLRLPSTPDVDQGADRPPSRSRELYLNGLSFREAAEAAMNSSLYIAKASANHRAVETCGHVWPGNSMPYWWKLDHHRV